MCRLSRNGKNRFGVNINGDTAPKCATWSHAYAKALPNFWRDQHQASGRDYREEKQPVKQRAGVAQVSNLGEMQRPPLSWRQSGRPRVADWIAGG